MARLINVKVDGDALDQIIVSELVSVRDSLLLDIERRKSKKGNYGVFHKDKTKDIAEMRKHVAAFRIILRYYGVQDKS